MISTLIFTTVATAQTCPGLGFHACMDNYGTCDWFGQCETSNRSQCFNRGYNECMSLSISGICSWSITDGKCVDNGCGNQSCEAQCALYSQCSWKEWCGYNDSANQQRKRGQVLCDRKHHLRRVEDQPGENQELLLESASDSSEDGIDETNSSKGRRLEEQPVENQELLESASDSGEDIDETNSSKGRRRFHENDAYCSKYTHESQCNTDSVCSWQQGWWSGSCKGKTVTGCQAHQEWDCAGHTGNNGLPCAWVGVSQAGSCVEQTSPSTCGMFYTESSCPANCQWSYWKNECVEKVGPAPSPSPAAPCGMLYTADACSNAEWSGSNCRWSYLQDKCVSGSNAQGCSQYGSFWPCSSAEGCKWDVVQNTCTSSDNHPIFCDTLTSESWCRMFSAQCTWSSYRNQCLALGN